MNRVIFQMVGFSMRFDEFVGYFHPQSDVNYKTLYKNMELTTPIDKDDVFLLFIDELTVVVGIPVSAMNVNGYDSLPITTVIRECENMKGWCREKGLNKEVGIHLVSKMVDFETS